MKSLINAEIRPIAINAGENPANPQNIKPVDLEIRVSFEQNDNLVYFWVYEDRERGGYVALTGEKAFDFDQSTRRFYKARKVWVSGKKVEKRKTFDYGKSDFVTTEEQSSSGIYYEAGTNDIRLAVFDRSEHRLTYLQVSVVAQGGRVFLCTQTKAETHLYRDSSGKIAWTGRFRKEVMLALCSLKELQRAVIEPVRVLPKGKTRIKHVFSEGEARLDWWDHARQVGALRVWHNGKFVNAKVHWKEAPLGEDLRRYCEEGNIFRVRELVRPQTETSFEWEARDVTILKPDPEYPPVRMCVVEVLDPTSIGVLNALRNSLTRK